MWYEKDILRTIAYPLYMIAIQLLLSQYPLVQDTLKLVNYAYLVANHVFWSMHNEAIGPGFYKYITFDGLSEISKHELILPISAVILVVGILYIIRKYCTSFFNIKINISLFQYIIIWEVFSIFLYMFFKMIRILADPIPAVYIPPDLKPKNARLQNFMEHPPNVISNPKKPKNLIILVLEALEQQHLEIFSHDCLEATPFLSKLYKETLYHMSTILITKSLQLLAIL